MRRTPIALAGLIALATAASGASPAAADPSKIMCPADMFPIPAALVNNGEAKDKNADHFVCGKPADCEIEFCGGPDYDLFGPPLLHVNGLLYYVTDNVNSVG
jgi:hypothetical protein